MFTKMSTSIHQNIFLKFNFTFDKNVSVNFYNGPWMYIIVEFKLVEESTNMVSCALLKYNENGIVKEF